MVNTRTIQILINACGATHDAVNVVIDSSIPVVQLDSALCPDRVLTLDATQPFNAQYEWSTGASNSTINVVLPGEYAVTVMTNCYTVSDAINVIYGEDCKPVTEFFIPNVFSPNGDGVNDVFSILFELFVRLHQTLAH